MDDTFHVEIFAIFHIEGVWYCVVLPAWWRMIYVFVPEAFCYSYIWVLEFCFMFKCFYSASGAWFFLIISTCWFPAAPIVGSFCLGLSLAILIVSSIEPYPRQDRCAAKWISGNGRVTTAYRYYIVQTMFFSLLDLIGYI